jgi:hypothetical protein
MLTLLTRIYHWMAPVLCLCSRQGRLFFAFSAVLFIGSQVQAQRICRQAQSQAFELLQLDDLQNFMNRYVDPAAPFERRIFNFGFSLVSGLHNPTLTYEFYFASKAQMSQPNPISPKRQIIGSSHFTDMALPEKHLELSTSEGTAQYRITDVGYDLLRKDDPLLTAAFDQAFATREFGKPFQIQFHEDYHKVRGFLGQFHQWASLAVTEIYASRKGYLSPSDLYALREGDLSPESVDNYFVLQSANSRPIVHQSHQEFLDSTLAIIRLVKARRSSLMVPEKYDDRILNPYELPVVKRYLDSPIGNRLKDHLWDLGGRGKKTVGEISRFVKRADFPEPLMDSLIKNVFEAAIKPDAKVDILLISVDRKTRRLFSKYRFQDLMALTDPSIETPEYLMYLDTSSPEFHQTLAELRTKSAEVKESQFRNSISVPLRNTYEAPDGWEKGSWQEAHRLMATRLRYLRAHDKTGRYNHEYSSMMLEILGAISPGMKVLIISEQKEGIFEIMGSDVDQSNVQIVKLDEIANLPEGSYDHIVFSGSEYRDRDPNLILSVAKGLVSKAKKRGTYMRVILPKQAQDNTVYDAIRSIPGADYLRLSVGSQMYSLW